MKLDSKTVMIAALIGLVVALIHFRRCGNLRSQPEGVDVQLIYDSIEQSIVSKLPPPDTIRVDSIVTRWLPGVVRIDTIEVEGNPYPVYLNAPIDTGAILRHYLTQAVTYIDTIRDSSLQAVIQDTIFRNSIVARGFTYKILRPEERKFIDKRDRFQLIASFQAGGGLSYANVPTSIHAGIDLGLKFNNGTYFSLGYMAGSGHFMTIRAGQVIRLPERKKRLINSVPIP